MPAIVIKDYTWRQTSDKIIIHVPLAGHPKKVDLLVIDNYMKASFPPFILELFLHGKVVEDKSKCVLSKDEAIFSLRKEDAGLNWPGLQLDDLSKDAKRECRNRAQERARSLAEERGKAKNEKLQLLQKEAVKAQINIDTATLNRIEAMRDAHRKEAMKDLEDWRNTAELPILSDVAGKLQKNEKAYRPPLKWFKDEIGMSKSATGEEISRADRQEAKRGSDDWKESKENKVSGNQNETEQTAKNERTIETAVQEPESSSCKIVELGGEATSKKQTISDTENESTEDSDSDYEIEPRRRTGGCLVKEVDEKHLRKFYRKKQKEQPGRELIEKVLKGRPIRMNKIFDEPSKAVPLPRKNGTINIKFSERAFPTPARESAQLEEQEWLEKQAEARRKTGFVAEDLRPEEQDPQWLKDKGDDFFKAGNYLGAISAYTHGIKISDKLASLYVNRSAAHYALGNYFRCVEDCTKALELMEPKCEGNRDSRARCHARRGAALCKLSAPQHGVPELEAALKLTPDNESIKRDLLTARQYFGLQD